MKNVMEDKTKIFLCLLEYEAGTVKTGQQNMSISGVWAQCCNIYQVLFAVCWMYRCSRTTGKDSAPNIPCCWRGKHLLWPSIGASPVYLPCTLEGAFQNITATTISDVSKGKNLQENLTGIETFECFWSEVGEMRSELVHEEDIIDLLSLNGPGPF